MATREDFVFVLFFGFVLLRNILVSSLFIYTRVPIMIRMSLSWLVHYVCWNSLLSCSVTSSMCFLEELVFMTVNVLG